MANYLQRAIRDGYAQILDDGKGQKINYFAVEHSERYGDPEEKVRADFWAELIYRYGYEPQRIGVEVTVPDRTPSDRADLIVFHDDDRKRPFAVIECKRDGISDPEFSQAVEQAFGNGSWAKVRADYIMVVAGSTRRAFDMTDKYGAFEREENIIADLPHRYGRPEDYKYHKGGPLDIAPVNKEALIAAIRKCHQTLWGGGRLSPPAAFSELSKIIFAKISDEQDPRKVYDPYEFQIKTHETSRRLSDRIRALYERHAHQDSDVFAETIKISDGSLRTVVSHLESINLSKTDLDTKGLAFEQFMDGFFKGDFGQYFTPREVISFVIEMVQPTRNDVVLDPACGSGGFLLYALDSVRTEASEYYDEGTEEHFRFWHDFAERRLFGIELNDEIARVAKMNMIIHDDGHTNVICEDALDRVERLREINREFDQERFDVILTNPPFGAKISADEHPYLPSFDLGNQTDTKGKKKQRKSQKSEILFLERIWQFLKPGTGRAAVILPDGILTNASQQYVRDFLMERFELKAVVGLPATAFAHYGAGVKSSIVLLRKRAFEEIPSTDEAVFMALAERVGYDATGRQIENELPSIAQKYREFQREPEPFFV